MEKLKDLGERYGVKAAGITAAAALIGLLTYKMVKTNDPEYGGIDAHFMQQNLALHVDEAVTRGRQLSNVKYELYLALGELNYAGKVKILCTVSDTNGLFIDF